MGDRTEFRLDQFWSAFAFELAEAEGEIGRSTTHRETLYAYGVLPHSAEAGLSDVHTAGVAMRASATRIWIYPYIVRQECVNGAIMAQVLDPGVIKVEPGATREFTSPAIGQAVRLCSAEATFQAGIRHIQAAHGMAGIGPTRALDLFIRLSDQEAGRALRQILRRFEQVNDRSAFGLMNAVTSTARDARDPDLRWQLELLGGEIAATAVPEPLVPSGPGDAARAIAHPL